MVGETVYVLVVDLIEYEMGETYCDCCGPETVVNTVESIVDSVHLSRESANQRDNAINFPFEYTDYDKYDGCVTRIEPKVVKNYQSEEEAYE